MPEYTCRLNSDWHVKEMREVFSIPIVDFQLTLKFNINKFYFIMCLRCQFLTTTRLPSLGKPLITFTAASNLSFGLDAMFFVLCGHVT